MVAQHCGCSWSGSGRPCGLSGHSLLVAEDETVSFCCCGHHEESCGPPCFSVVEGLWSWTGIECLEEKRARSTWCPCVLFVHLVVIPGVGTWWRALSSLSLAGPSCPLGSPLLQHPAHRLLGGCSLGLRTARGQLSAFFLQWFFSLLSPSPIFPVPFLPFCHNKCFILSDTIPVGFYHCVWFSPETKYCYL